MISTIPIIFTSKQKTLSLKAATLGTSLSLHNVHSFVLLYIFSFKFKKPSGNKFLIRSSR